MRILIMELDLVVTKTNICHSLLPRCWRKSKAVIVNPSLKTPAPRTLMSEVGRDVYICLSDQ